MYNKLFNFLDNIINALGNKLALINRAKQLDIVKVIATTSYTKLLKYYKKISIKKSFLFNIIIVLDLIQKLTIYKV